jgi:ABC-type xylose transport system substrate-binding protein
VPAALLAQPVTQLVTHSKQQGMHAVLASQQLSRQGLIDGLAAGKRRAHRAIVFGQGLDRAFDLAALKLIGQGFEAFQDFAHGWSSSPKTPLRD